MERHLHLHLHPQQHILASLHPSPQAHTACWQHLCPEHPHPQNPRPRPLPPPFARWTTLSAPSTSPFYVYLEPKPVPKPQLSPVAPRPQWSRSSRWNTSRAPSTSPSLLNLETQALIPYHYYNKTCSMCSCVPLYPKLSPVAPFPRSGRGRVAGPPRAPPPPHPPYLTLKPKPLSLIILI